MDIDNKFETQDKVISHLMNTLNSMDVKMQSLTR